MVSNLLEPAAHYEDPVEGASMASTTTPGPCTEAPLTAVPAIMTSAEVGRLLRVSPATLCRWRQRGSGPRVLWLSPRVPRYLLTDVQQWIERTRS
jgi:hypothetical protein